MVLIVEGLMFSSFGASGCAACRRSADPDLEVEARLPCLPITRRAEARTEAVVLMLKVLCESPPVPTISHF